MAPTAHRAHRSPARAHTPASVPLQVADFKTIVFRQQLLGFNAVRLPFTFSNLNLTPKIWTKACTDDTAFLAVTAMSPCSCAH